MLPSCSTGMEQSAAGHPQVGVGTHAEWPLPAWLLTPLNQHAPPAFTAALTPRTGRPSCRRCPSTCGKSNAWPEPGELIKPPVMPHEVVGGWLRPACAALPRPGQHCPLPNAGSIQGGTVLGWSAKGREVRAPSCHSCHPAATQLPPSCHTAATQLPVPEATHFWQTVPLLSNVHCSQFMVSQGWQVPSGMSP